MFRFLLLFASVLFAGTTTNWAAEKTPGKTPLDLPVPGGRSADDPDEDAPESISFYGTEYEGDAFFWCFHAFNF